MRFFEEQGALIARSGHETIRIEAWSENSLRVRSTMNRSFTKENWALSEPVSPTDAQIEIEGGHASISNGDIRAEISDVGLISVYRKGERVLHEYRRNYYGSETDQCIATKYDAREFRGIMGGNWRTKIRFESRDDEKMFGMGQYQQPYMNLKGCLLELGQRNSQVTIPFFLSNLGYGLLWNNPGTGRATFGMNLTEFDSDACHEMDYWITVADTPAEIVQNYTGVTGRPGHMPSDLLGLWQCKLRYRTQEEVLEVARKYHELGIPIDVIVIDFFHWTRQGDWQFDPVYWPDPKAMCDELHSYGIKVMVSIWPSVDKKSIHFAEMNELGYLMQTDLGANQSYDFQGDCLEIDAFNPEARKYIWDICKKNYYDLGIDMFWLDNIEPDLAVYDYENFRYYGGSHLVCGNLYPQLMAKAFYDGLKEAGQEDVCLLTRCGWAGNAKYGTLLWSGDVNSTFGSLRTQIMQGLNMGIAGIPWWTTDIGGFMTDDCQDADFIELLLRWFEFGCFSPIVRLHGTRGPLDIEPLSELDYGGGYLYTGHDNEIWSYGKEAQAVMEKYLKIREEHRDYIEALYEEASRSGLPLMRAMFLEFPEDEKCWDLNDQYMFGSRLLVAPVTELHARKRKVYLPEGEWQQLESGVICPGSQVIEVDGPLDTIPVFRKIG